MVTHGLAAAARGLAIAARGLAIAVRDFVTFQRGNGCAAKT